MLLFKNSGRLCITAQQLLRARQINTSQLGGRPAGGNFSLSIFINKAFTYLYDNLGH
jgi:hypothetical protein